jgi:uncharacterized protein (TIGR02453 family)
MKELLSFLKDLKENNTREWFQKNKERYEKINAKHHDLVANLIGGISKFDNDIGLLNPKDCVFRLYRDTRFSTNKDPYKTAIGAVFSNGGRKGVNAGYYLHLEPGNSFIGGGLWRPEPAVLKAIRYEVYNSPNEFVEILEKTSFKKWFRQLEGEKLQRPPKDFPADFQHLEIIKHKSFVVSYPLADIQVVSENLITIGLEAFAEMKDFIAFLNRAVANV